MSRGEDVIVASGSGFGATINGGIEVVSTGIGSPPISKTIGLARSDGPDFVQRQYDR
jgi:hypothetical protein